MRYNQTANSLGLGLLSWLSKFYKTQNRNIDSYCPFSGLLLKYGWQKTGATV